MPLVLNEVIEQLSKAQAQIWQTASSIVSEAANQSVTFSSPLTVSTTTAELYSELGGPMTVVQFAFASQPESPQVILIPQDSTAALAEFVVGSPVDDIDENIVTDLRGVLEAVVQGICLGVGHSTNDLVVATGLSIRFQIFAFPPNLQRADRLIRSQIAVGGEDLHGSLIWLMDLDTAGIILGSPEIEDGSPFPTFADPRDGASISSKTQSAPNEEQANLERLIDVPLEISVELGRVKMLVKDILDLGNGSILEIDKAAGEPVDVLVNGQLMAKGEVVVIEDNFGVRITEIIGHRRHQAA
jgi:flagellar motor switch protein FliN/FliY